MRGGVSTAWQRLKRSKREKPKIVEKYLGYLSENSPKAKDYLEQFPWLETVPPSEIGRSNNRPKYNVNPEKEDAIRTCTLEKVIKTLGEKPRFFDRCYENPIPCYYIFSKNTNNVELTLGSLMIRSKNECLSELAEHTPEYKRDMKKATNEFYALPPNGNGPRDGETGNPIYPGPYGEEPDDNSEYPRREEEERNGSYKLTGRKMRW